MWFGSGEIQTGVIVRRKHRVKGDPRENNDDGKLKKKQEEEKERRSLARSTVAFPFSSSEHVFHRILSQRVPSPGKKEEPWNSTDGLPRA